MSDTLLVDGTDLTTSKRRIQMWDDALSGPILRGENVVIPYAAGEILTDKVTDARDFTVGLVVIGTSMTDLNAELETLYGLLPGATGVGTAIDTSVTLTLRRSGQADKTCTAEYVGGLSPQYLRPSYARLTLRFRLVDGWFT